MSIIKSRQPKLLEETAIASRRKFLLQTGTATFSATAIALLSGCSSKVIGAEINDSARQDVRILNTAISAEQEAVAAYKLGAESGLLEAGILKVAVKFQGHHKEHIDALSKAVKSMGGNPVEAKKDYAFPVEKLKQQSDVLEFAAGLERRAISAYAGAIPVFGNRDLSAAAASILADEAMHWSVLLSVLGLDPVPGAFFS